MMSTDAISIPHMWGTGRKIQLMAALASCCGPKDGTYTFTLLTTNDVHGCYFDSTYVGDRTKNSLLAVSHYADSIRNAVGEENVILIDAGDLPVTAFKGTMRRTISIMWTRFPPICMPGWQTT